MDIKSYISDSNIDFNLKCRSPKSCNLSGKKVVDRSQIGDHRSPENSYNLKCPEIKTIVSKNKKMNDQDMAKAFICTVKHY